MVIVLDSQTGQLTPEEQAAENKRQATAAFVVAIDLAKAGGLTQRECHEVVNSRPHQDKTTEQLALEALGFIRNLAGAKPAHSGDEYGLTADRIIELSKGFLESQGLR